MHRAFIEHVARLRGDPCLVGHLSQGLNERCARELAVIGEQYPFKPLKFLKKSLRLTFAEGIQMLQEAGHDVDPLGDFTTEMERTLGRLVHDKYHTDFYMLHRYPSEIRPFYTMPCPDDPRYSNSYDIFIRGEEIISGAQVRLGHCWRVMAWWAQNAWTFACSVSAYVRHTGLCAFASFCPCPISTVHSTCSASMTLHCLRSGRSRRAFLLIRSSRISTASSTAPHRMVVWALA